jgi:predicted transcriptional regulator
MTRAEAQEFTEAIGQVCGGTWRVMMVAVRQGVPEALGLTAKEWATRLLGGYIRMEVGERREAVRELKANGMTQRQIADTLGVAQSTISNELSPYQNRSKHDDKGSDSYRSRSTETEARENRVSQEIEQQSHEAMKRKAHARMRDDSEVQRQFAGIKLRVCVKIGEISRDLETAQGHRANDGTKSKEEILAEAGIAKRTAYNYEELAGRREEQAMALTAAVEVAKPLRIRVLALAPMTSPMFWIGANVF